ncbi:DUF805 domain-containing protein [Kocuria rosea]|uniref:DUF805 domain-containing protein n=1 Tax=Kocuria rosea TaxID=1275 RepID=UPI00232D1773|nr:DUF805 domain-containing protein [Kocuria rosea]
MSSHDPYSTPWSAPMESQAVDHDQPPTFGGRQGYSAAPHGYGHQHQQGYLQSGPYGYLNKPQGTGNQPGVIVGPGEAIMRFYSKYAQFSGRASRSEYWWVALYLGLIYIALIILMDVVDNAYGILSGFEFLPPLLMGIFVLGHIVPSIAIGVRRLHDINKSGWIYLIALIPYFGGIVLMALSSLSPDPAGARFDR